MNCQEVMEYMQRQLDGDLDERETEILMTHTRHCPECADMLERLKRLSNDLESLPKVTPPYSLVDAILPKLEMLDREQQPSERPAAGEPEPRQEPLAPRRADRKRGWTDRISFKMLSGFAAVGIAAALFVVMYDPPSLHDSASKSSSESADASESAGASESADRPLAADAGNTARTFSGEAATKSAPEAAPQAAPQAAPDTTPGYMSNQEDETIKKQTQAVPPSDRNTSEVLPEPEAKPEEPEMGSMEPDIEAPIVTDENKMGIASFGEAQESDDDAVVSNDGAYKAYVVDNTVKIYATDGGALLFASETKDGVVGELKWSEDSATLYYEVRPDKGEPSRYAVDPVKQTETPVEPE